MLFFSSKSAENIPGLRNENEIFRKVSFTELVFSTVKVKTSLLDKIGLTFIVGVRGLCACAFQIFQ